MTPTTRRSPAIQVLSLTELICKETGNKGRDQKTKVLAEENISACAVIDVQFCDHGWQGGTFEIVGKTENEKGEEAPCCQKKDCVF